MRAMVVLGLAVATLPAWGAPLRFSGNLGEAYDSNVGNTPSAFSPQHSTLETAGVSADYFTPLGLFTSALIRGSLDGEVYNEFNKLSNGKATLMSRLYFKPGGDFFTPMLAGWASASYAQYGSSLRDGEEYRGGVFAAEQVTTAISTRLDVAMARRNANSSSFDLISRWVGLNVDWILPGSVTAYGGYQYRTGQIASTFSCTAVIYGGGGGGGGGGGSGGGGGGGSDDGLGSGECAYKIKARTQIAMLGANIPLAHNLSFDLQGQYATSSASYGGVSYTRWLTFASLLARF